MPNRAKKPLTAKTVETAKPPDRGYVEIFDAAMPGMCLRVTSGGQKSYILTTRISGRQSRITLGRAAGLGALTLADARRRAGEIKDLAKAGKPLPRIALPSRSDIAEPGAMTFGVVAEQYIERECPKLARGTEIEAIIRRELLPSWRNIPIADLRRRHARSLTDAMSKDRPAAAFKLHETYCRVLNWALGHFDADELDIEVSPFAALKPPVQKTSRGRALSVPEIQVLWEAWTAVGYPFGDLQKLLLLTAQRRAEVAEMRWDEVDLAGRVWTIPAGRSKSRRANLVPLSDQALDVLAGLPRFGDAEGFAFSTTSGKKPVSGFSKAKAVTDAKAALIGEVQPWRWHDLRRTARSGMAEIGVPEIVSERLLNHAPRGLVGVYNIYAYESEKAEALQRWGRRVMEIVSPPPENVVALREGAK